MRRVWSRGRGHKAREAVVLGAEAERCRRAKAEDMRSAGRIVVRQRQDSEEEQTSSSRLSFSALPCAHTNDVDQDPMSVSLDSSLSRDLSTKVPIPTCRYVHYTLYVHTDYHHILYLRVPQGSIGRG